MSSVRGDKGVTGLVHLTVGLALAGCHSEPPISYSELGEGGLVALVYLGQNAELVAASGLVRPTSPIEIEIDAATTGARRVLLVGFDFETINRLTDLDEASLRDAPLTLAGPGDPSMPRPRWWARAVLGEEPIQLETAPESEIFPLSLTAPWLPPCDRSLDRHEDPPLRLSCGSEYCESKAELRGCDLHIDTNLCSPSLVRARLGVDPGMILGVPAVEGALGECRAVAPRPNALYSLDCGGSAGQCLVDVFPRDLPLEPGIVARSSEPLFALPPIEDAPDYEEPYGYLAGLAHSGTRLLVSTFSGQVSNLRCAEPHETELFVLSDDTLELVATATAPPCLSTVVGDSVEIGFFGIVGNPARAIVRIGANGRIVNERPLPAELGRGLVAVAGLYDAEPLARAQPPDLVFIFGPDRGLRRSYLVLFDPSTLEARMILSSSAHIPEEVQDYVSLTKGHQYREFVVLDRHHEDLWSFFLEAPEAPIEFPLGLCGQAGNPLEVLVGVPGNALFRSYKAGQGAVGLFGLRSESLCRRFAPFEFPADPTAMIRWQDADALQLVGLRRRSPAGDPRAYLAFFDSLLPGFLPGVLEIGHGEVGPFVSGRGGAVFTTLPWSARVVRIDPVP